MPSLSNRSSRACKPIVPYVDELQIASKNSFNPDTKEGYINLAIAENNLNTDMFEQKMKELQSSHHFTGATNYDLGQISNAFKAEVADLMQRNLCVMIQNFLR